MKIAEAHHINLRLIDEHTLGVSLDETTNAADVAELWQIFNGDQRASFTVDELGSTAPMSLISAGLQPGANENAASNAHASFASRQSTFLTHPVFNRYHSETGMLRYIKRLESRDLSLTASMIPLGSCTMKLNAAAEMFSVSWPEFARLHPFAPLRQTRGYQKLFEQLETWLAEITGLAGVSLQPNAGSQGEYPACSSFAPTTCRAAKRTGTFV